MTSPKKGDRIIAVFSPLDFDTFEAAVIDNRHGIVSCSNGRGPGLGWRGIYHPDLTHPVGSRAYEYLVASNPQVLADNEASRLLVRYLRERKKDANIAVDKLGDDIHDASTRVVQSTPEVAAVADRVREALALLRAAQDAGRKRLRRRSNRSSVPEVG